MNTASPKAVSTETAPTKTATKKLNVIRSERGQAATEYLALIILVALVCIPVVRMLPEAVRGYVRPFYYCISRPLP